MFKKITAFLVSLFLTLSFTLKRATTGENNPKAHLALGKEHGVTKDEAVEIVTQLAFYCGGVNCWGSSGST